MVETIYGGAIHPHNPGLVTAAFSPQQPSHFEPSVGPSGLADTNALLGERLLVCPADCYALLYALDNCGMGQLNNLAAAIPHHPHPISAVLALVDAGLLAIDLAAPFDADMPVWTRADLQLI